jgi:nucleoside-diphosphate-sugar epimerase
LALQEKNKSPTANEIEYKYLSAEKTRKALEWKRYNILERILARKKDWYRTFFAPSSTGWVSR